MNIIIVGSGISGLYSAFKLNQKYKDNINITIYEKNNILGGRIHTIYKNNIQYEAGAGRFNKNHKLLIKLINELNLQNNIIPIKSDKVYIKNGKIIDINSKNKFILNKLLKLYKILPKSSLKSVSLLKFMNLYFNKEDVKDFINSFGYNSEFEIENAYDSLNNFKTNFIIKKFYILQNGFSSIINEIINILKLNKNITIKTNSIVNNVDLNNKIINVNNKQINYDKIIFCITKADILKFPNIIKNNITLRNTLNTIKIQPLCRIYAQFPKESNDKVWFHNIPRITTNNIIRYIIPINYDNGLIMISYTDGKYANIWNKTDNNKLENKIMKNLKIIFPNINISKPLWIKKYYWLNAIHYPTKNYIKYINNKNTNYFICGEMLSENFNGWIEGALESVENIIKFI